MTFQRRRVLAFLAGLACLGLLRAWTISALPPFPPHDYQYEWFLKPSPGEIAFLLRYLIGGLPVLLLISWGVSPWVSTAFERLGNRPVPFRIWLGIAGVWIAGLTAILSWGVLNGQVVTADEYAYIFQSRVLLEGRAAMPAAPMWEFLENGFVVTRQGRWFGQYPPGHPLLLVPGLLVGVPRLMPILLCVCNVLLIGTILRRVVGRNWALVGVFLLGTSPLFLLTGSTLLSHSTAAFALGLAVLGSLVVWDRDSPWWGALAGLGIGLAVITRPWTGVTLGIFPGLMLVWAVLRRGRRLALLPALLVFLFCCTFFLVYNAQVTGDPFTTGYEALRGPGEKEFGFGTIFSGAHIHTPAQGFENAGMLALRFVFWSCGWSMVLALCVLAFVPGGKAGRADRRPIFLTERKVALWAVLMLVVGFLSYVPYWATGVNDTGPVKTYELLLPFIVLIVLGARRGVQKWGLGAIGAFFLASFLCATVVFWPPQLVHVRHVSDRVAEPLRLAESEASQPALIFVSGIQRRPSGSWVYSWPAPRPDLSDRILYVRDVGPSRNSAYWRLHPERHAYRLIVGRNGFQLVPLARRDMP
jgi:4-amino-4-deoxy-L-arabinose transferase-like glycosyltransferase